MFSGESELVRTMRLVESLKGDLVCGVGELYKALAESGAARGKEALAEVVLRCYVLGRRLGIDFNALDEAVARRVEALCADQSELEMRFGDFSNLARHLRDKR